MNQSNKFERYTDATGTGMSSKDMKYASWVARHRVAVRRVFVTVFSVVAGSLCTYGIIGIVSYALFGLAEDDFNAREMVQSTANYETLKEKYRANELRVLNADVYEASHGKYDFAATVVNDNKRWAAILTYKFLYSGGSETEEREAVILPLSERPVLVSGHKNDGTPTGIAFEITNVSWRHIDTHEIADIETYMAERRSIAFSDMSFIPQSAVENIPSNILKFTVQNQTSFGFWDVPLIVELFDNGNRIGIAETHVEKFKAGEKRTLDLRTLTPNIGVTDITVHMAANIFDSRVFMAPEAN